LRHASTEEKTIKREQAKLVCDYL